MSEPIYLRIVERGNELIITTQRERLTWRDIVRLRFPVDIELSWVDPAPPVRALVEEMVARWNAVESASPCAFVISDGELCGEEVRHPIHFMDKSWHEGRPTHFYVPTGEEAWWSCTLCGFSAAILCRECRSARHMPAPRGATCSERHHEYQTLARPSSPTGETAGQGAGRDQNPPHGAGDDGLCVSCGFSWPCRGAAGQGVEEAWEGMALLPSLDEEPPLRGPWSSWLVFWQGKAIEQKARATAAEAERDRLREEWGAFADDLRWHHPQVYRDVVRRLGEARRALAGESTGAGEGE